MSERWIGPGWWMASDGKWYPPRGERSNDVDEIIDARPAPTDIERPVGQAWREPSTTDTVSIDPPERMRDLLPAAREAVAREQSEERAPIRIGHVDTPSGADSPNGVDTPSSVDTPSGADEAQVIDLTNESSTEDVVIDLTASASASQETDSETEATPAAATGGATTFRVGRPDAASTRSEVSTRAPAGPTRSEPVTGLTFVEPPESNEPGDGEPEPSSRALETTASVHPVPLQHAVLATTAASEAPQRNRQGAVLLLLAAVLAIACGVVGALWLQARADLDELRTELDAVTADQSVADKGLAELNGEIDRLELDNQRLEQQLADASALVLELPAGRVTEIAVPFTPVLADEENERLIALGEDGSYVIWAEGVEGPVTGTGTVTGSPTGLFASTRKAWISTDAQRIEILALVEGEPGLPAVEFGPTGLLAQEERGYWTFNESLGQVVRLRKSDGGITAQVTVPTDVVDLTIGAGSVWALGADGLVYRINTADFTVQPIDAGPDVISITAGPDSLWTLSAADGSLRRIDPVTAEILVTVPVGRDPVDAAFGGSSVWVALRSGTSLIEVDTRTSAVISRTAMPSEPIALHHGDTGVFVAMEGDVRLVRVSSLLTETEATEAEETEAADE